MLDKLHNHIVEEIGHSTKTDTIFIVVAIIYNFIVLAINSIVSGIAASNDYQTSIQASDIVLIVFVFVTILVNLLAIGGLYYGRDTRSRLINGLENMYKDNGVDKYYDKALLTNYSIRYLIFGGVIVLLAITSIIVPVVIRIF